jgi:hypothetical protein
MCRVYLEALGWMPPQFRPVYMLPRLGLPPPCCHAPLQGQVAAHVGGQRRARLCAGAWWTLDDVAVTGALTIPIADVATEAWGASWYATTHRSDSTTGIRLLLHTATRREHTTATYLVLDTILHVIREPVRGDREGVGRRVVYLGCFGVKPLIHLHLRHQYLPLAEPD